MSYLHIMPAISLYMNEGLPEELALHKDLYDT